MATNFLEATGGSSVGFITAVVTLVSSELVSLASSGTVTSATVFTQSSFGQAVWADAWLYAGGAVTPTAGGYIACWWLKSFDGGTTFEKTVASTPLPRAPDFIIPAFVSAYASSDTSFASGTVKMPWPTAKLLVQNNLGVALPSSAAQYSKIALGPAAIQY